MQQLELSEKLFLRIEREGKRVRLIIADKQLELACRKEYISVLMNYLLSTQMQLFKGRLQLQKYDNRLAVFFKGEAVGEVDRNTFENALTGVL